MKKTAVAILCCASGLAGASNAQLAFDVYLDDRAVGTHRVHIADGADGRRVQVEAKIDVTFLSLPLYRYRHSADEVWRDGCLVRLEARTDDDGERLRVAARQEAGGMLVEAPVGSEPIAGCVRTFAYWDPALLGSRRLLNTQTGEYEETALTRLDSLPPPFDGRAVGSRHYRLQVADKAAIDLWYGPDNAWEALQTEVSGGRTLRYVRQEADR